ncbi:hypothetical protein [Bacteriovorax sp. Seq25_V]|uniref:hypothetical protein n=1 Tax=Bacteriovorax sp. Seq25_V TaxID=1201288 RepID=UPI000389E1EB|nr:hypothetical protein [Bacteriovorax sp. Seq25_V]EQC43317.1 membrane protein, PF09852 family [Bacteriovorax sp. Seq25_V]
MFINKNFNYSIIALCVIAIFSLLLATNIKGLEYSCFNLLDYGVYHQALVEITSNFQLNPFLTGRGINIFNDHFDPIIFLASPLYLLLNNHLYSGVIFESLILFCTLHILWKYSDKGLYLPFFFILSKGVLNAYRFPIHPTTWSSIFIILMLFEFSRENYKRTILYIFCLCICKESWAFSLIFVPFFFYKKSKSHFIISILIIYGFILFELFGRKLLLGTTFDYSNTLLSGFKNDFFTTLMGRLRDVSLIGFAKLLYPFAPLFFIKFKISKFTQTDFLAFSILLPLLGIHVLCGKLGYHYDIQFLSIIFALILVDFKFFPISYLNLSLILFLLSGMGSITKLSNTIFRDKFSNCEISSLRLKSINRLKTSVTNVPISKTIGSTGGIINTLIIPNRKIYHHKGFGKQLNNYDYFIVEKGEHSNTFPQRRTEREGLISHFIKLNYEIYYEDEYFVIFKEISSL